MEARNFSPKNLTPEQLTAYKQMLRDVQFAIIEFEQLETYPPFSIISIKPSREEFHNLYWKLWREGNELLETEFPSNFRPYKELYAKFGNEIRTAKEYRDKSNGNPVNAAQLYAKDKNIKLSDEDFFIS